MRDFPTETRADLQRFFGVNVESAPSLYTLSHVAACAASFPLGSATLAAYYPAAAWTSTDYRLHLIACILARKVLPYPWEEGAKNERTLELDALPVDEFGEWYSRQFT